MMKTLKGMLVK